MYANFQCRMDWCVKPYAEANHHPVAVIDGDSNDTILRLTAKPGQTLKFNASGSHDPDQDELTFHWWQYREAGTYPQEIAIENIDAPSVSIQIPVDAVGTQIHTVFELSDKNPIAPLYDYRRIVIDVTE